MMITIRFMPDAEGVRPSDLVIGDLCSYHISQAGWLRVEIRNPDNPAYHETRYYPPQRIDSVTEVTL